MIPKPELTILTVCHRSAEWIAHNHGRFRALNPGTRAAWVIVENDPTPCTALQRLDGPDVLRISGAEPYPPSAFQGSLHHAAGLAAGLARVETRFLLVLDPDCFPVVSGWADEVLDHMKSHRLAVLGTRWETSDFTKARGFPAPHFCLIDTERLPLSELDFSPDPERTARSDWKKAALDRFSDRTGKRRLSQLFRRWFLAGSSHDTGSRMASRIRGLSVEFLDVKRRSIGKPARPLDSIEWRNRPFAVHFRQVRAREHGTAWTLETGAALLEVAHV